MTRTTIQSESTRVPPVTEVKSPPDSRITGADSPVMALSSTEAAPSMTSPSAGMTSPGLDQDDVALAQLLAPDVHRVPVAPSVGVVRASSPMTRLAHAAQRRGLRLAAPLGEGLGEVREQHREHSQTVIARMKPAGASPWPPSAWTHRIAVRMLPM